MRVSSAYALGLAGMIGLTVAKPAAATTYFDETWESPVLTSGGSSSAMPDGWVIDPSTADAGSTEVVYRPSSGFAATNPVAAPAGGNQVLALTSGSSNGGIYKMTGITVQANTTYTFSAAIGAPTGGTDTSWSMQLWTDGNDNGVFDWTAEPAGSFIGQNFGTYSGYANNPAAGQWATNIFVFNSASRPDLIGQQLIVFLNNYVASTTSYYDNVTFSGVPDFVPEPASVAVMVAGGLLLRRRRRRAA